MSPEDAALMELTGPQKVNPIRLRFGEVLKACKAI